MALIYPPGVDLIAAFYGCLYVGVVPVTIRPPHPQNLQTTLPTVRMIVDVSKSIVILSAAQVIYFQLFDFNIFISYWYRTVNKIKTLSQLKFTLTIKDEILTKTKISVQIYFSVTQNILYFLILYFKNVINM